MSVPHPFTLGGEAAWYHDEGLPAGYFHTYDALRAGGSEGAPRKVHVFLPRDYEASGARYPVLYMNDGDTAFFPGGPSQRSWDVAGALAALYKTGRIPEVIAVAIHPREREREYTHTEWSPGRSYGGLERYTRYVAEDVKGFVDAHYRTKPEASSTCVLGSSAGGLAAFFMAGRRPDRFGAAGCLSPSFWAGLDSIAGGAYGGGPLESSLLIDLVKGTLAQPSARPRLWIDWGLVRSGGPHNAIIEAAAAARGREMVALLERKYGYVRGIDLFALEDPEGAHDEDSWARRLPLVLKEILSGRNLGGR
jgi:pimeloyl-ACP methyl ester carboxylesterase